MNCSKSGKQYPLIALRQMSNCNDSPEFINTIFAHCDRYPGTIDEIWFSLKSWSECPDFVTLEQKLRELLPYAEECRKRNIRFALQMITLGHGAQQLSPQAFAFTPDVWSKDVNGDTMYGLLCPASAEVQQFFCDYTKLTLQILKPDALWPDDDLRLCAREETVCFCDRCIELYNTRYGHNFTREELVAKLFKDSPDTPQIRREWIRNNTRHISECAAVFRKTIDEVYPQCELGLQRTRSTKTYDTFGSLDLYRALAGKENKFFALRSGGGFYHDLAPRDLVRKCFDVGRAAAVLKSSGFECAVCIEAENYPHISVQKSPGSLMTESAMSISAGGDFTSVYWHGIDNRESDENYEFFMKTCSLHRPFIEAVRDATLHTLPGGCARYLGEDLPALPEWLGISDETEERLAGNALPMTVPGTAEEVYVVNDLAARSMTPADIQRCFAKPVLMDVRAFETIAGKFPHLEFVNKVKLTEPEIMFDVIHNGANEIFAGGEQAQVVFKAIQKCSDDVELTSKVSNMDADSIGGCAIIPTGFGGAIVLTQFLNIWHGWTGYRRDNILDALDKVVPGRLSARLLTAGYSVYMHSHRDTEGRTTGVFLLNGAIGDTPPLRVALRNPGYDKFYLYRQTIAPVAIEPVQKNADEVIFEIPSLAPWRAAMIAGK